MNVAVVKKTQSSLGKVIKKPILTERLLSKPPFRYLHDIFAEIIRTTGFMKGLYKENELRSECVKDKDMKMAFLQKAIDVVSLVMGEPLAVKPAHIVAGHEPERTNELLQAIAKCCINKISSKDAVKRVLAGERLDAMARDNTVKENVERCEQDREEKKKSEPGECKEEKDPEQPREQERQRRDGEREHRHDRERCGKIRRREQDHAKNCDQNQVCDRQQDPDKDNGHGKAKGREKEQAKDQERESIKAKDNEREKVPNPAGERPKRSSSQTASPASLPQASFADDQKNKTIGDTHAAQRPLLKESGDTVGSLCPSEMVPSDKQTPRPSSARPAPPPVKKQESYTECVPPERLPSAKSSVIRDGKKLSDDDEDEDEQFLVAEAPPEPADAPEKVLEPALNGEEKHGGLVKKILETKKDYELSPSTITSKEKLVSEEAWKKEQDLVMREIERLRASIQSVCQSALPLGKIMDYVQEDIDAMQAELQSWRKENKEHAQALQKEQRATDQAVEPLKTELGELEQKIKDYQDQICAVRSNILINEEKIQKKLAAIISSKT
ncbi:TRAF3-interacting protein 1-like [Nerophis lumbriciformis]|uniref:TRAF3-interacting protein 1-like n=1 Tax=Nerophis lumbriciformis TaxID=546530 RepID=UPI002AE026F0|nr:TRAF3-interacting protein 1-like [Nerophis lumbriciformis]